MADKSERALKEEAILKFWKENKIFQKTLDKKSPKGEFVFYDGPPFATGLPHYGHILPGTIKDVIPRYKTMQGFHVPRRWGWDCHGLPIENLVEKELGLETKKDIEKFGIGEFNKRARASVLKFEKDWKEIIPRTGRWIDMDHSYKTMDSSYAESVWWSFKNLYDKGLVYQGFKSMHLCPHCETTLSNFEVNLGYKDIADISVTAKFELVDEPGTYLLAWTTTPWTLPGNVALAINQNIEYVVVEDEGGKYILAKALVEKVFTGDHKILKTFAGQELVGKKYKTVFDYYFKEAQVYGAEFVSAEEGTGIVHIAPGFGEDDYQLSLKEKLPLIQHVGTDGKFKSEVTGFAGMSVKPKSDDEKERVSADISIIKYLQEHGTYFDKKKIMHSYPHCWRCDTPLLNYASSSWFVSVTKIKDDLVKNNKKVKWIPKDVRDGRFGKWLEGARDWAVSRSRFWGTPIPVWQNSDASKSIVVDSVLTLKKYAKKSNNKYSIIRHGQSTHNLTWGISTKVDSPDTLTEQGRGEVLEAAKGLVGKGIDTIIISPFLRTRETAKIVQDTLGISDENVVIDNDLHELNVASFEGKTWKEYHAVFPKTEEFFDKKNEGDESYKDVRVRMMNVLERCEEKYKGKNILFVTHGGPAWILTAASEYLSLDEMYDMVDRAHGGHLDVVKNAEVRTLDFVPLPHNEEYELDLHRPHIDNIVLVKDGEEYKRIPEVFDTWYDSGSVPFASRAAKDFRPADFIAEGLDQTRGWFYTQIVLSTALFGKSPYKQVVVNGLILAEDGKKMSKKLKNYPELNEVLDKHGADALRYYLVSSPAVRAEDLAFSEKSIDEIVKKNLTRLENVVSFYELYLKAKVVDNSGKHVLDRWIDSRLESLIKEVGEGLENYELDKAVRPIADFIDDLSTWYLRRSRNRPEALNKLREVLLKLSKVMAPFTPFIAEDIYLRLKKVGDQESVHLCEWPSEQKSFMSNITNLFKSSDKILEDMAETRKIVSLALEQRSKTNIKVRQPLQKLMVKDLKLSSDYIELVKDEVNVKEVVEDKNIEGEVALDTALTPELIEEGKVRDAIRAVQDMRKEKGLNPSDLMEYTPQDDEKEFFKKHSVELEKATNIKIRD